MGLEVSPMCDRDAISLCNMQMGFIEFVVAPLIIGTCWFALFSNCMLMGENVWDLISRHSIYTVMIIVIP